MFWNPLIKCFKLSYKWIVFEKLQVLHFPSLKMKHLTRDDLIQKKERHSSMLPLFYRQHLKVPSQLWDFYFQCFNLITVILLFFSQPLVDRILQICYSSEQRKDFRENFDCLNKMWFFFLLILSNNHSWILMKLIQMFEMSNFDIGQQF